MSDLPPEILHNIFRFLADPDKSVNACFLDKGDPLVSCSLVNSTWRATSLPYLWRLLDITESSATPASIEFFLKSSRLLSQITPPQLTFRQTHNYIQYIRGVSITFSALCPNNESSTTHDEKFMAAIGIIDMFTSIQSLRFDLRFRDSPMISSYYLSELYKITLDKVKELKHFALLTNPYLSDSIKSNTLDFLSQLSQALPSLNSFEIAGGVSFEFSGAFVGPEVRTIALQPSAESGMLRNPQEVFAKWRNLRDLTITLPENNHLDLGAVLQALAENNAHLEILNLIGVNGLGITDQTTSDEHLCRLIDLCPNLSELNINLTLPNITDLFLRHSAQRAFKLRQLHLLGVPTVTGHDFVETSTPTNGWVSLQSLEIGPARRQMNPAFVETVSKGCPKLRKYTLGDVGNS